MSVYVDVSREYEARSVSELRDTPIPSSDLTPVMKNTSFYHEDRRVVKVVAKNRNNGAVKKFECEGETCAWKARCVKRHGAGAAHPWYLDPEGSFLEHCADCHAPTNENGETLLTDREILRNCIPLREYLKQPENGKTRPEIESMLKRQEKIDISGMKRVTYYAAKEDVEAFIARDAELNQDSASSSSEMEQEDSKSRDDDDVSGDKSGFTSPTRSLTTQSSESESRPMEETSGEQPRNQDDQCCSKSDKLSVPVTIYPPAALVGQSSTNPTKHTLLESCKGIREDTDGDSFGCELGKLFGETSTAGSDERIDFNHLMQLSLRDSQLQPPQPAGRLVGMDAKVAVPEDTSSETRGSPLFMDIDASAWSCGFPSVGVPPVGNDPFEIGLSFDDSRRQSAPNSVTIHDQLVGVDKKAAALGDAALDIRDSPLSMDIDLSLYDVACSGNAVPPRRPPVGKANDGQMHQMEATMEEESNQLYNVSPLPDIAMDGTCFRGVAIDQCESSDSNGSNNDTETDDSEFEGDGDTSDDSTTDSPSENSKDGSDGSDPDLDHEYSGQSDNEAHGNYDGNDTSTGGSHDDSEGTDSQNGQSTGGVDENAGGRSPTRRCCELPEQHTVPEERSVSSATTTIGTIQDSSNLLLLESQMRALSVEGDNELLTNNAESTLSVQLPPPLTLDPLVETLDEKEGTAITKTIDMRMQIPSDSNCSIDAGEDPYVILRISPKATIREIKKAYFKQCRMYHPDKATNDEEEAKFTVMMFKINDANDILRDENKRKAYDEDKRTGSGTSKNGDSEPLGGAYRSKPPPKLKPKPKPGNLGQPYEGPMESYTFDFTGDGEDGENASPGHDGSSGQAYGQRGRDGGDASPAGHGYAAADLEITLKTTVSEYGYFEVKAYCARGETEALDLQSEKHRSIPLKVLEKVEWTARGGGGGNGGRGGDGGKGYRGENGSDAKVGVFSSVGGNGGDGGDGGNGGRGINGGDGGKGGDVDIVVDRSDVYLLMRVAGCDPRLGPDSRQAGGRGGAAGRHGRGGSGGAGGRGGSSASYTTSDWEWRDGVQHKVYTEHIVPGGYNGSCGRRGATPSDYLRPGRDGKSGNFQIRVREQDGSEHRYEHRYDLAFQSTSTKQLSDLKGERMFEFGETVIVVACSVRNTGGMETPNHRVIISFDEAHLVNVERQDRLFLPRNRILAPGNSGNADQGSLRFECPYPQVMQLRPDFEPVRKHGSMRFRAHQLGPENRPDQLAAISDFQERYRHFHESAADVAHMAYPIENLNGFRGARALAPQETSILELSLINCSNQSFGHQSETGRELFVQFYYADDMEYRIPLKDIKVRDDSGRVITIDPTTKPKGHRQVISFLPRAGDKTIRLSFKLVADIVPTCARAALQADIYIQKIPTLHPDGSSEKHTQKQLIQRRQYVVSCQPKFAEGENSDVVLVTTTSTDNKQVEAWESVISKRLGLRPQVYSLSRYGHLDASRSIEAMEMEAAFSQKLIIVLNEEYYPQPNVEERKRQTCRPTKLLNSAYDFEQSTRFLVVGGGSKTVEHLSPRATCVNAVAARSRESVHPNQKSFRTDLVDDLQNERVGGFQTERIAPVCHKIKIKTTTLFTPKPQKIERILEKRTARMKSWLKRQDTLRPYVVEWEKNDSPDELEKKTLRKNWEIGNIRVCTGSSRFQNSLVLVGEEGTGCDLSSPVSIRSRSMLYSTLNAAHFKTKIRCLCRSVEALVDSPESNDHLEVCEVVIDCLVGDFVWDIANYLDGRMKIENAADRALTLHDLLADEQTFQLVERSLSNEQLCSVVTTQFSMLVASLKCVAKSKDLSPGFPFSRKHVVRKAMLESISLLEERWQHVLDEEKMTTHQEWVETRARLHIKEDRKKMAIRTKGRWRAALAVLHSPKNLDRYPQVRGISPANVRVRKHAEFESGSTTKIKGFFPETLSPKESKNIQRQLSSRLDYSANVLTTTNLDRDEFMRLD